MLSATYDLHFTFTINGLDFKVIEFEVEEGLSSLFTIQLLLASEDPGINEDQIVDEIGTLKVMRNNALLPERYFHGIAYRFSKGDTGHHYTYYRMTLVPELARLSLRVNSRIFQEKNVIEIAEELFQEMGLSDYQLAIRHKAKHLPREYCVQYCESDLAFIERLFAEEGIFYYFEHTNEKHILILADDNSVLTNLESAENNDDSDESDEKSAGVLEYNNLSGSSTNRPYIRSLERRAQLSSGKATLKDYSFLAPSNDFLRPTDAKDHAYYNPKYEHYIYPGRYKDVDVGEWFSETRVNYLRRDAQTIKGISNISSITPGFLTRIMGHLEIKLSDVWVITHVKHHGTQPQALAYEGREGETTYNNTFYALPKQNQWKPKPEPKPRIYGPQIGTIVGPENEEIYTDKYGRVKVQFPWDRDGKSNENSSCWIRVAQVGAGSTYGNIVIPRTGHEVIVSFLEGDPDQPVVTGATFHATNPPPINLPEDKTKMSFRGRTHDGSHGAESTSFNELSFENDQDRQLFYMQAEKDMSTFVKHDRDTYVQNDHSETVDGYQDVTIHKDQTNHIHQNQQETIDLNQTLLVKKNQAETVGLNRALSVGIAYQTTVGIIKNTSVGVTENHQVGHTKSLLVGNQYYANIGEKMKLSVGKRKVEETGNVSIHSAGDHFEIVCGKSKIVLTQEGNIYLKGMNIHLQAQSGINADANLIQLDCGASEAPPDAPEE